MPKRYFAVANKFVDVYLKDLKPAEVFVLLVVFRQTAGWVDRRTGKRKQVDWISRRFFRNRTGLSYRSISEAIRTLQEKGLIQTYNQDGVLLTSPQERKFAQRVYFSIGSRPVSFTQ